MREAVPSVNIPQIVDRKPGNTSHHVRFCVEDDVHTQESVEAHSQIEIMRSNKKRLRRVAVPT